MTNTHVSIGLRAAAAIAGPNRLPRLGDRNLTRFTFSSATLLGDGAVIWAASILLGASQLENMGVEGGMKLPLVLTALYLFAAWACGAYRLETLKKPFSSGWRALLSLAVASCLALLAAFAFSPGAGVAGAEILLPFAAAAMGLVTLRWIVSLWLLHNDEWVRPDTILLGDESVRLNQNLEQATQIDVHTYDWRPHADNPDFLNDLSRTVGGADRIVLSFKTAEERREWSRLIRDIGLPVELLEPNLAEQEPLALGHFGSTPTLVVSRGPLTLGERALKRAFDLAIVLLAMPVVLPLVCILAILVRLDSPGPVLFVQRRIGTKNLYFNCLKFRTMRADLSDKAGNHLTERNDPRITRLGSFLRRTSFDELPQLWNVLKGEMSLVGPRPHALGASADGALYWEAVPGYWRRHSVKPGLTGLAQIRGFRGPTERRSEIENRVAADLEYINSWSLWLDVKILFRTLKVLVHHNAF